MLKILFITVAVIVLLFFAFSMICVLIVSGQDDEKIDRQSTEDADKNLF